MDRLWITSTVMLAISLAGYALWRFVVPFPDWLVLADGILMLAAIALSVYSTIKIMMRRK